jgi:hypothetical protein
MYIFFYFFVFVFCFLFFFCFLCEVDSELQTTLVLGNASLFLDGLYDVNTFLMLALALSIFMLAAKECSVIDHCLAQVTRNPCSLRAG